MKSRTAGKQFRSLIKILYPQARLALFIVFFSLTVGITLLQASTGGGEAEEQGDLAAST